MTPRAAASRRTACWIAALGALALATPLTAGAQDDEKPGVVSEDLGDGFRAVSVNGGPAAIVDDATGMILKQAYGRTIIYDQETGATLYLDDDGEPVIKHKSKSEGDGATPARVERMKTFMQRAQAYRNSRGGSNQGEGLKDPNGKASKTPKTQAKRPLTWDAVVAAHMRLLEADDETKLVIEPRLRAVLLKQDELRRSCAPSPQSGAKPRRVLRGSLTLPAAVRSYLRAFAASQEKGKHAGLEQGLAAYRAARAVQHTELKTLREALRELLTVPQEGKLVALGVLD